MNLDSLMDTLTNVVGFMIMLMVMMMLGVGDAVKRIKETNPELGGVSAQELAQIKAQAADVAAVLAKLQEQAQPLSLSAADAAAQLAREKPPSPSFTSRCRICRPLPPPPSRPIPNSTNRSKR
jgi:heme/copper-type cytochrome/quinol oxidase subunit 1